MTDRLKGVLVTFDRDIRNDDAEPLIEAIKMIRGVFKVKPYISEAEDYMLYEKGHYDARESMMKLLMKDREKP